MLADAQLSSLVKRMLRPNATEAVLRPIKAGARRRLSMSNRSYKHRDFCARVKVDLRHGNDAADVCASL